MTARSEEISGFSGFQALNPYTLNPKPLNPNPKPLSPKLLSGFPAGSRGFEFFGGLGVFRALGFWGLRFRASGTFSLHGGFLGV